MHYYQNWRKINPGYRGDSRQWQKSEAGRQAKKRYESSPKGRYHSFCHEAKRRKLSVSIDFSEFEILTSQLCFYCKGFSPEKTYCGLDRIDSNLSYASNNVVPCCSICNRMKLNHSISDFVEHIRKILKNLDSIANLFTSSQKGDRASSRMHPGS